MKINPAVKETQDGSQTLLHPISGDSYHSLRGAKGESLHVFIKEGLHPVIGRVQTFPIKVLEVGLGSCLNAWLTAVEAETAGVSSVLGAASVADVSGVLGVSNVADVSGVSDAASVAGGICEEADEKERNAAGVVVEYHAVELYPVDEKVLLGLDYAADGLYRRIVSAPWGRLEAVSPHFAIKKREIALQESVFDTIFDLVYYDAFAYDTQPEMWSVEIFRKVAECMRQGAVLVTYSAKGVVKENLREAGFEVKRLPGALGKRHMLRAVKL